MVPRSNLSFTFSFFFPLPTPSPSSASQQPSRACTLAQTQSSQPRIEFIDYSAPKSSFVTMSINFTPQWVKSIKPTGTSASSSDVPPPSAKSTSAFGSHTTPSATPATTSAPTPITPAHPFPALGATGTGRASPTTAPSHNPALSYSRITNPASPQSPGFPQDSGYFPDMAHGNTRPFRYNREQILGLWDEERVKEIPIELAGLLDAGGILVSKEAVKPVGLRGLSEVEKKLLATSVHPVNPVRRNVTNADRDRDQPGASVQRRVTGTSANGREGSGALNTSQSGSRSAFSGFGRGEGGAFGGGKIGGAAVGGEIRGPGALGGGFGGVSKRLSNRRGESSDMTSDVSGRPAPGWRANRTTSGTFEGVLGFGQSGGAASEKSDLASSTSASGPWRDKLEDRVEEKDEQFGSGGGPGWGSGQKKWRLAAGVEQERTLDIPIANAETMSVAATASATPIPERDATMRDLPLPATAARDAAPPQAEPPAEEKTDLGAVEWFYRDPEGNEQGPFAATLMHEWYSHAYFADDLPVRRAQETSFQTLAELKTATGNGVQPFISPVRPRLPPNLPIPVPNLATGPPMTNGHPAEAFRNLAINPASPYPPFPQERSPFSPGAFGQFGQPAAFASPGPWSNPGGLTPQRADSFGMRSPFGQEPFPGHAPQMVSPGPGGMRDPFGHPAFPGQRGFPGGPIPHGGPSPWDGSLPPPGPAFDQAPGLSGPHFPQPPYQLHIPPPQDHQQHMPFQPEPIVGTDQPAQLPPPVEEHLAPSNEPASYTEEPVQQQSAEHEAEVQEEHLEEPEEVAESEEAAVEEKTAPAPPASVWGQVKPPSDPPSRKQSLAAAAAAPAAAPAAKLPPAPASLPAKPALAADTAKVAPNLAPAAAAAAASPVDKPSAAAKSAPWANKEDRPILATGPSLRDIQDAEAKVAESRRAALAEARAAASPSASTAATEDVIGNMSWGLPSSGSGKAAVSSPAAVTSPPAAWGSGDAGPKKTLKQIQEEEERRKKALAARATAAATATSPAQGVAKRGYADLAAAAAPPAPPVGWSTVGMGGKVIPGAAPKASAPVTKSATTPSKPALPSAPAITTTPTVARKANGTSTPASGDEALAGPSVEFLKWTKSALTGLKIPIDDFIQMLLTFPVDPPASSRAEVAEIISDSVYANSSTLDGRRFAQEFMEKRKADARRDHASSAAGGGAGGGASGSGGGGGVNGGWAAAGGKGASKTGGASLADVVKSVPTKKEDLGFKVVKAKGKKK